MMKLLTVTSLLLLISACAAKQPVEPLNPIQEITLHGVGLGTITEEEGVPFNKSEILAVRASQLAAYRHLAEQLYGVSIDGVTTISELSNTNDVFEARVRGLVKGAKITSVTPMGDGTFETRMTLKVNEDFESTAYQALGVYKLHKLKHLNTPRSQQSNSASESVIDEWFENK